MSTPQNQVFLSTTQTNVITVNSPGPQGPTGPMGNPGPTGPATGVTGPTGPPGPTSAPLFNNEVAAVVPSGQTDDFSPFGYVPGTTNVLVLTPTDDTSTLAGLSAIGVQNGFSLLILNASATTPMYLLSQSSGTSSNQFVNPNNATLVLQPLSETLFVYFTGYGWSPAVGSIELNVYYPAMTTTEINAAMVTASAAGGGTVRLQPGSYPMTGPLIAQPNVALQGADGFGFNPINPSFTAYATILTGDGTFNGLQYNNTDLTVEPTNSATFIEGMCPAFSVMNITFSAFLNGIKLGALYNPGIVGGNVINVSCINCQAWGMWLENFFHCANMPTNAYCTGNALGQVMLASSGGTANQNGNSYANNVIGSTFSTSLLTRGLVLCARGVSGIFNQYILNFVGAENEGKTATTQSNVVMNSGSANIGVTNSSLFIPDQPVVFTGTVTNSGFQLNTTYFVISSAANVLQVSALIGGTPIQATGVVSGLNLVSYGFPGMEVIAYQNSTSVPNSPYTGTHATILASEIRNLDIEAQSGQYASLINVQQVRDTTFTFNTLTNSPAVASVVHRGSSAEYFMRNSASNLTFDIDTSFGNPTIFGTRSHVGTSAGSSLSVGGGQSQLSIDATDTRQLKNAWMYYLSGIGGPELKFNGNSYATEFAGFPIALPSTNIASGSTIPAQTFGYTSSIVYTTAGSGTLTLPVIPANGEGEIYCISNPSNGTCTVSSQSSQAIIGAGVSATSYAIPPLTDVYFRACINSSTLYWAVLGVSAPVGLTQNLQTINYTLLASDANNLVSMNGSNLTATIPANASVAYAKGTLITLDNQNATNLLVTINGGDTLILAGTTSTGTRTIAQNGLGTLLKTGTTTWKITGPGVT